MLGVAELPGGAPHGFVEMARAVAVTEDGEGGEHVVARICRVCFFLHCSTLFS